MPRVDLTPFQAHKHRWQGGCGSDHCEGATVCLARGQIPCDVLFVGEAPGECIARGTLVETAFRDKRLYPKGVPVEDLVGRSGFQVYCVDEGGRLTTGIVNKVWRTGFKKIYKVSFFWWGPQPGGKGGRKKYYGSIRVTANHPFLLKSGEYRSIQQGLEVGNRLQPFYRFCSGRRYKVGTHSGSMVREAVFLLEKKIGRPLAEGEQAHHDDRNPDNDTWNNLMLMDIAEHARLHGREDNVMFDPKHRESRRRSMNTSEYKSGQSQRMKDHLANPENRRKRLEQIQSQRAATADTVRKKFATDPIYYYKYLVGRVLRNGSKLTEDRIRQKMTEKFPNEPYPPSEENHTVYEIKEDGKEFVYDMEVDKYHNFAANGIIVHNSENAVGHPFARGAQAGRLMQKIIDETFEGYACPVRYALTNLVGCIPRDEDGGKLKAPDHEQVMKCKPRLEELVRLCSPRLVVCVGKEAREWIMGGLMDGVKLPNGVKAVHIVHPAWILRSEMPVVRRRFEVQKCVVTVRAELDDLDNPEESEDDRPPSDSGDRVVKINGHRIGMAELALLWWLLCRNEDVLYPTKPGNAVPLDVGRWEVGGRIVEVSVGSKPPKNGFGFLGGAKLVNFLSDFMTSASGGDGSPDDVIRSIREASLRYELPLPTIKFLPNGG